MATTNQRSRSGGQKGSDSGKHTIQKAVSQPSSTLSHMRDEVAGYVSQGTEQFGRMTRGHEGQAVLVALAAGFGIGFVIGCSLVTANRRPRTWRERMMAEGFGRKIMDRVETMLPEIVSEHLHR
jgi:hypothetical protein